MGKDSPTAQPVLFLGAAPGVQWRVTYNLEIRYNPVVFFPADSNPHCNKLKKNVDEGKERLMEIPLRIEVYPELGC